MTNIDKSYRKTELIELHDRGIMIHPYQYSDALAGWSEYAYNSQRYVIDGSGLSELAKYFGIDIKEQYYTNKKGQCCVQELKNFDIPILRKPIDEIGTGKTTEQFELSHKIKEIWAKIIQPNLISIQFVTIFDEEQESKEEIVQEVTYSGSFTVWWSDSRSSIVEDN